MKKQIVLIHGGEVFEKYEDYLNFLKNKEWKLEKLRKVSWRDSLQGKLGSDFDVLRFHMPCKANAKYEEWKIYFEGHIPLLDDEVIMIGHSLGGVFLTKYLSEEDFPKKIEKLILVAPPFDDSGMDESLGTFSLTNNLEKLGTQAKEIKIFHSSDDPVVPFSHSEKYKKLLPQVEIFKFEDRQHLTGEEFPEIVEELKSL